MWLLSLFQRKHVPNCVVPHVWFVGEAVGPWAALGRALSAPSGLVCLTDRCQAHRCHLDTWSIWQMLKFCQSHTFICKSSHSYFQKEKKCLCLSTPKCLLSTYGRCPALLKSKSSLPKSPSRNHRASQSLHTLPPVITAEALLALSVTSPVSFFNHQKTLRVFTYTIFTLLQSLSFRSGVGTLPSTGQIQTCGLFFPTKFHWKAATLFCSYSVYDFSLCTAIE